MIQQDGAEWICSVCKKRFSRVENAIMHDFSAHTAEELNSLEIR